MMDPTKPSIMLPPQASTMAAGYDLLFYSLTLLILVCFVAIMGAGIYFVWKYRWRGGKHEVTEITHNTVLEVAWSVIPLFVVMGLFAWGFRDYLEMLIAPKDALEIRVTGKKWKWSFEYENGATSADEIAVPVNKPVRLVITSTDVLHSFFIPNFRTKMDAVPKRYTTLWFQATQKGEHQVFCAEYCGDDHSAMLAKVKVMEEPEYQAWVKAHAETGKNPVERGQKLFAVKGGCVACHAVKADQAQPAIGPKLWQVFGRQEHLADGTTLQIDENYLRESIEYPQKKTVAGYEKASPMPTFKGVLTDAEISDLIAYLKSLK